MDEKKQTSRVYKTHKSKSKVTNHIQLGMSIQVIRPVSG